MHNFYFCTTVNSVEVLNVKFVVNTCIIFFNFVFSFNFIIIQSDTIAKEKKIYI